jgi:STE24 endopeptidase
MKITRWILVLMLLAYLPGGIAAHIAAAQAAAPAPATQPVSAAGQPGQSRQAYKLPPEKLAKAVAISRIRDILDIVGSVWGLVVLWLLLATRAAAGLEAEIKCIARHRWAQGIFFFAAFFIVDWIAGLPLNIYGHYVEHSFGISIQSWGACSATMPKIWGSPSPFPRRCCCSSTGSCADGRGAIG